MAEQETKPQDILSALESQHEKILHGIERLDEALSSLCYEGKLALNKNLHHIGEVVVFLKEELFPHIELDENIVFPFVETHVPKLNPLLHLFRSEHKEFHNGFKSFEHIFKKLKAADKGSQRAQIIGNLRDQGFYLIYLMRNHINVESRNVYDVIARLTEDERKQFRSAYKQAVLNRHMAE